MAKNFNVSIIVATYNPKLEKVKSTLFSAINQKNITFEIIVTDDGSAVDYFDEIEAFFKRNKFYNYKLIKNKTNIGTVKNFYNALKKAKGEYVFATSPGDLLYDENTLVDLYDFAQNKNVEICFGDAVYYSNDKNNLQILKQYNNAPLKSEIFDEDKSLIFQKIGFFSGNGILGASFFRKKEAAIKYIGAIENVCKYVEDNTSTAFALANNVRIYHLKRYVVWYEYGTGVSTSKNLEWKNLLKKDFDESFKKLYESYPNDLIIKNVYYKNKIHNKLFKAMYLFLTNPKFLINVVKIKCIKKSIGPLHVFNEDILKKYIKIGSEN